MKYSSIGVDFDGVLADTTALKQEQALQLFGVKLLAHECKEQIVVKKNLMSREQYRAVMERVCAHPEIGLRMQMIEGGVEYLRKLIQTTETIRVITARSGQELEVARIWCMNNGLNLDFVSVGYGGSKVTAADGLDVYIDDDVSKLLPLVGLVPRLYLFHQSYNADIDLPLEIKRVFSWGAIEQDLQATV